MEHLLIPYQASPVPAASKVLVLAPHADDEVFGCGGALALHAAAGAAVRVIILTDGAARSSDRLAEAARREAESRDAAAVLGIPAPECWGLPDRGLEYNETFVEKLAAALRAHDADLVYAPSLYEAHPDHRAVAMAAVEAVRRIGGTLRLALCEIGIPGRPTILVDITSVLEKKRAAMRCFVSQLAWQNYDEQIEALNRYRAYTLPREVSAVEAFELLDGAALQRGFLNILASEYQRRTQIGLPVVGQRDLPLVSVLIRSMDRETLDEALNSVAAQTYPNIEVVVASAKGAGHRELPAHCGRFPLRYVASDVPLSRPQAANICLNAARGPYLNFLDDDDLLLPHHVATLVEHLGKFPECRAAYGDVAVEGDGNGPPTIFSSPYLPLRLVVENYIPIHAVMFSRETVLQGNIVFDESLPIFEDWDFWISLSRIVAFSHVPIVTARYRSSLGSSGVEVGDVPSDEATKQRNAAIRERLIRKWLGNISSDEIFGIVTDQQDKIKTLNGQIRDISRNASEQAAAITEKDRYIHSLRDEIASKEDALLGVNAAFAEKDRYNDSLRTTLSRKDADLQALEAVIAQHADTIHWLGEQQRLERLASERLRLDQLGELQQRQKLESERLHLELSNSGAEIARLRNTLSLVRDSLSWRITAPLRGVKSIFRR